MVWLDSVGSLVCLYIQERFELVRQFRVATWYPRTRLHFALLFSASSHPLSLLVGLRARFAPNINSKLISLTPTPTLPPAHQLDWTLPTERASRTTSKQVLIATSHIGHRSSLQNIVARFYISYRPNFPHSTNPPHNYGFRPNGPQWCHIHADP